MPVNSFGNQGYEEIFEGSPNFTSIACIIRLNYVQHIFPGGRKFFHSYGPGYNRMSIYTWTLNFQKQTTVSALLPVAMLLLSLT